MTSALGTRLSRLNVRWRTEPRYETVQTHDESPIRDDLGWGSR